MERACSRATVGSTVAVLRHSIIGSYLDPLADKILIVSVVGALAAQGAMHAWMAALILGRDIFLLAGAFGHRAHVLGWKWRGWKEYFRVGGQGEATAAPLVQPLFISKVNTVLQLGLVGLCITQAGWAWPGWEAMRYLEYITAATTVASTIAYVEAYVNGKILR